MSPSQPKISVITVVLNAKNTIRKTIESVLAQKGVDFEYLILDGGSIDGTIEIIAEYQAKLAKVISEPDGGIYPAMNKGLGLAKGEFIWFLNADDHFVHEQVLFKAAKDLEGFDFLSTSVNYILPDKQVLLQTILPHWDTIPHPGFIARTEVLKKFPFDTSLKYAADIDLFIRLKGNGKLAIGNWVSVQMASGGAGGSLASINECLGLYAKYGMWKRWLLTFARKSYYRIRGRY